MKEGKAIYNVRKTAICHDSASLIFPKQSGCTDIVSIAGGMAISNTLNVYTHTPFQK